MKLSRLCFFKKNINYLIHSLFFAQYIKKYISQAALHILIKDPFSPLSVSLGPFYGGWRGYWFTTCQHVTPQTLLVNKTCIYFYSQEPGKEITNSQWGPRVSSIIECSLTLAPLANISHLRLNNVNKLIYCFATFSF